MVLFYGRVTKALQSLGYHPITLEELLDILHKEEAGISQPEIELVTQELELNVQAVKSSLTRSLNIINFSCCWIQN